MIKLIKKKGQSENIFKALKGNTFRKLFHFFGSTKLLLGAHFGPLRRKYELTIIFKDTMKVNLLKCCQKKSNKCGKFKDVFEMNCINKIHRNNEN